MTKNSARQLLAEGGYTCVLLTQKQRFTSTLRGVRPLVEAYESGIDYRGCDAADKVVGKATAFLYALIGAKRLYASVISRLALEVLLDSGIEVSYDTLVPYIINRRGDGACPFETAVAGESDAMKAYNIIKEKMSL